MLHHDEVKVSLLKIGLGLLVAGIIWTALIFDEAEKAYDSVLLKQNTSFELESEFVGEDIGFYKIHMIEFAGEEIFIQVLDTKDNVVQEEKIQTRMSVGYFDFDEDGIYKIKISNISKAPVELQLEFGNTNSKKMAPSGILILVGAVTIMVMSYIRIKNYKIEQPEENIS